MTTDQKRNRILYYLDAMATCKEYQVKSYDDYIRGMIDAWGCDGTITVLDVHDFTEERKRLTLLRG